MPALLTERLAELAPGDLDRFWERLTDVAKTEVAAQLRQERGVVANLSWYRPRGAAQRLAELTDPEILLSGPAGTGKSMGCLQRLFWLATHYPGMRGLIVRKTAKSLTSSALVTWKTKVAAEALASGFVDFYGGSAEEPAQYRFVNGSKIMLGGMDASEKVMSTDYDWIFVQEAIELTETDWEKLTTRLRNGVLPHMQLIGDTNPATPTHWLKARCDRGATVMLESRHEDNPTLIGDDGQLTPHGRVYLSRLDALTGVRFHRLRSGLWVAAEGIIYADWDDAVHLVDRFPIPDSWTRWWSVDFGYTNPFTCQWWAQDPDGRLWMYREIYHTQRLVEDHAAHMLRLVTDGDGKWIEPRPRGIICDHDAEGRATLERKLGMSTVPAVKNVTDGIEAVQARLRAAGDGRPRLMVLRDSLVERDPDLEERKLPMCLTEEVSGYVWAPGKDGKPAKEEPLKVNDHAMDAARYLVYSVDRKGRASFRWL